MAASEMPQAAEKAPFQHNFRDPAARKRMRTSSSNFWSWRTNAGHSCTVEKPEHYWLTEGLPGRKIRFANNNNKNTNQTIP